MSAKRSVKNILNLETFDKNANTTESDYKSEVVAASLIDEGYDADRIFLVRNGGTRRGFAKDIDKIELQFSQHDLLDYLYIFTNKEGLYDILPEGIFHQPINKKQAKTKEDILDEIKVHRQEEFFARKFFQPFEVEVDYAITKIYLYELKYDKKISYPHFINIFKPYWLILKYLTNKQAILFMHSIPLLHQIRNQHREVEQVMSKILDVPVCISKIKLPAKKADSHFESILGDTQLGADLVLGKTFDDGQSDIKVTLGPVSAKKMEYFLEPSVGHTVLDNLCKLFLSADIFWIKEFKISPENANFILSHESLNTYLGVNTFI